MVALDGSLRTKGQENVNSRVKHGGDAMGKKIRNVGLEMVMFREADQQKPTVAFNPVQ